MKQIIKSFVLLLVLTAALAGCGGGGGGGGAAGAPAAGSLDTAGFNASGTYPGKVITDADYVLDPGDDYISYVKGLAVQSDGKIVAVGYAGGGWHDFAVARYKTDGTLDTASFHSGGTIPGVVNTGFTEKFGYGAEANAVAIDSSGNIVVAGGANDSSAQWYFALARYNKSDGSLDTTFNSGGGQPGTVMMQIATTASDDRAYALAIQTNGMIVLAGYSNDGAKKVIAVARYKADGSGLDTGFNTTGIVTQAFGTNDSVANAIAIQADGKIVVGGYSKSGSAIVFTLMRLSGTDGSLDTSFGTGGIVTTAIGTLDDEINALALQSDGKIVAVGYSEGSQYSFAVARYTTGGVLDTTFNSTGTVTTDIGTSNDEATAVAIDSSGRIVTAGYTWTGSTFEFALVRYNTDGSIDTSFGTSGKVTTQVGTTRSMAFAIALQSDGKIVAVVLAKTELELTITLHWCGTGHKKY